MSDAKALLLNFLLQKASTSVWKHVPCKFLVNGHCLMTPPPRSGWVVCATRPSRVRTVTIRLFIFGLDEAIMPALPSHCRVHRLVKYEQPKLASGGHAREDFRRAFLCVAGSPVVVVPEVGLSHTDTGLMNA